MTVKDRTYYQHNTPSEKSSNTKTLELPRDFVLPWLQPGQSVLDCGCGLGTITLDIAQRIFPGQVTGIDLDANKLVKAERLAFGLEQVNASFRKADIYQLPFGDHYFDLVFASALFQNLTDPAAALSEVRRVLRPDGLIALGSLEPSPDSGLLSAQSLTYWLTQGGFHLVAEETHEKPTFSNAGTTNQRWRSFVAL
jgi:ubiquinone/menaquinone biosynthesis C-methylase UbiE